MSELVSKITLLNQYDFQKIIIYYHTIYSNGDIIFNLSKKLLTINTQFDNVDTKFHLPKEGFLEYNTLDDKNYKVKISIKQIKPILSKIYKAGSAITFQFHKNIEEVEKNTFTNGTLIISRKENTDISLAIEVGEFDNLDYVSSLRGYNPMYKTTTSYLLDQFKLLKVNTGNYGVDIYENGLTIQSSQERDGQMCLISINMDDENFNDIEESMEINYKYLFNITKLKAVINHGITEVHYIGEGENRYYVLKISYSLCGHMYFYMYPDNNK